MNACRTCSRELIAIWLCFCASVAILAQPQGDPIFVTISPDPKILHLEVFFTYADSINVGPNLGFRPLDNNKGVIFAQLSPETNSGSDFILRRTPISWDIAFRLHGSAPPYKVEFEQSVSAAAQPKKTQKQIEFPVGELTQARLFDTFDVKGFYGNPQQKRP